MNETVSYGEKEYPLTPTAFPNLAVWNYNVMNADGEYLVGGMVRTMNTLMRWKGYILYGSWRTN